MFSKREFGLISLPGNQAKDIFSVTSLPAGRQV
jgi:hypothetical protein